MPLRTRWANDYTECFRGQDEGWAVYPPIKSSALKPGMCGYFDVDGIWQTIVDLTNPDDVQSKNLPAVHDVEFSSGNLADTKHWGLRKSKDVSQEDITAQVMANLPGAPAGGRAFYKYSATSNKAALLLTKGPVIYRQVTPNEPLLDWVVENRKEILKVARKPKRGVWIITKTYSANDRCLSVLHGKRTAVTVEIDVTALNNTGQIQASSSFWREHSGELWNTDHDEEGVVLAMCGIKWKTLWYSSKGKPVEERRSQTLHGESGDLTLRPHDLQISSVEGEEGEEDDDAVRLEPEMWGKVEGVAIGDEEEVSEGKDQ